MNKLINPQRAFLFQGVGADYRDCLGMFEKERLDILKQYCSIVKDELGLDLLAYLFQSREMECDGLFYDWIAIYTCDYMVYQDYVDAGIRPAMMAGYSMGLITAMACGQSITFLDGLRMLRTIYEYPKGYADECGMGVIVGKTYDEVCDLIAKGTKENDVFIASENNESCLVLSGVKNSIEQVLRIAEQEGAIKATAINTPYGFHSPYAARGIKAFIDLVDETFIRDGETPIVSVFTQTFIQNASDLRDELIKNMASPMNWKAAIQQIGDWGVESFVEVSLGDSLTKISRMINLNYKFLTYKKFLRLQSAQ
ncbi:acyltransferase domain-containing protein [Paenibacillus polymyxa]|uniref:acyltransferase domain-containing protein n=1 Tax=Paenibacillus taichungensis TaxID=484184 RepID=UPI0035DBE301